MTRRRGSHTGLDQLLGQLPTHDAPPGLARKIVARTRALPQHPPRETIIAALPPPHRTLARHAVGQRLAGLSAFAAAACLIMVLWPLGAPRDPDHSLAVHRPMPVAVPDQAVPRYRAMKASEPAMVHVESASAVPVPSPAQPAPQLAEVASVPPVTKDEVVLPVAAPAIADAAQAAEIAGPKMPKQGPPVPAGLGSGNGLAKTGLGVAGGAGGRPASLPQH